MSCKLEQAAEQSDEIQLILPVQLKLAVQLNYRNGNRLIVAV